MLCYIEHDRVGFACPSFFSMTYASSFCSACNTFPFMTYSILMAFHKTVNFLKDVNILCVLYIILKFWVLILIALYWNIIMNNRYLAMAECDQLIIGGTQKYHPAHKPDPDLWAFRWYRETRPQPQHVALAEAKNIGLLLNGSGVKASWTSKANNDLKVA